MKTKPALLVLLSILGTTSCVRGLFLPQKHPAASSRQQLVADFYTIHKAALAIDTALSEAVSDAREGDLISAEEFRAWDDRLTRIEAHLDEALLLFHDFERTNSDPAQALAGLSIAISGLLQAGRVELPGALRVVVPPALAAALALLELEHRKFRELNNDR